MMIANFLGIYFAIGLVVAILVLLFIRGDEGGFDWRHRDTYEEIGAMVVVTLLFWPALLLFTCALFVYWFFGCECD